VLKTTGYPVRLYRYIKLSLSHSVSHSISLLFFLLYGQACHYHVALPAVREASYNVAVAGSIVMYDRLLKAQRQGLALAVGEDPSNNNQEAKDIKGGNPQ